MTDKKTESFKLVMADWVEGVTALIKAINRDNATISQALNEYRAQVKALTHRVNEIEKQTRAFPPPPQYRIEVVDECKYGCGATPESGDSCDVCNEQTAGERI